jgi:hypothetical protein
MWPKQLGKSTLFQDLGWGHYLGHYFIIKVEGNVGLGRKTNYLPLTYILITSLPGQVDYDLVLPCHVLSPMQARCFEAADQRVSG